MENVPSAFSVEKAVASNQIDATPSSPVYPWNDPDVAALPEAPERKKIAGLVVHPLAELFPLMEGDDFAALVLDIKTHGLREPVHVDAQGRIVDGRNRGRACVEVGVKLCTTSEGVPEGPELMDWIISRNLHRRHLTPAQRAAVAADMATLKEGRPKNSANLPSFSQAEAAGLMNVSPRSVTAANAVKKASPELHAKVKAGEISTHGALKQIAKQQAEVDEVVTEGSEPSSDRPSASAALPPVDFGVACAAAEALADFKAWCEKYEDVVERYEARLMPHIEAIGKALCAVEHRPAA
jgi:ParB-like chromosome segregation protein Spo0J